MRTAIFDLDGTLVDSSDDICASFAHALAEGGHPPPDRAAVRALIGRPLSEMFPRFAPGADVEALVAAYRAHHVEHCADTSVVLDGAVELLDALRAAGFRTAVATTKPGYMARRVLSRLGLLARFDHVQGTDGFAHKPAPDVIHRALAALGVPAGPHAWMVGDTTADILAARAAGIRAAGVTSGPHDAAALRDAGAEWVGPGLAGLHPVLL